jgi:ABC-2 type transport system ATP-binding protein
VRGCARASSRLHPDALNGKPGVITQFEITMNDAVRMNNLPSTDARVAPAIAARGLVKCFGEVRAVDGIDLDVPRGMIFAILGPNGAGKTTLMRMLATLSSPDAGEASIMGHDLVSAPHQVRASIAMTGQFASLDVDLTGRENLLLLARLWGFRGRAAKKRADDLLAAFDLSEAAQKQVKPIRAACDGGSISPPRLS